MQNHTHRALSLREAARIIYATEEPTPEQVERVRKRLESGVLAGTLPKGRRPVWRTTTESVARYMATQAYQSQVAAVAPGGGSSQRGPAIRPDDSPFGNLCRDILKDYFEALIFRRRAHRTGKWFQRAVVTGQAVLLGVLLLLASKACRQVFRAAPPEQVAIERWLAENTEDFQITTWHPAAPAPDGRGVSVRVAYRYFAPGGKAIHTDRRFVVRGDRVVAVDSD